MSQQEDERYMRLALEEAQLAYESGEIPIGAVVVCDGRVIARAHNEVERLSDPTAHAEVLAVTAATQYMGSKFLGDCRLYVTIEPCTMCAGALHWARLGEVIYGASEKKFGYQRYAPEIFPRATKVRGGVLAEEARALMQSFFRARR
jgi:tRNA-specific adenosine deaminase